MTQAFNLSQLANKVNSSGQLDISTGVSGTLPNANNGGVTAIVAGTGVSVSGATGSVTVTNAGVTSVNGATGAVTTTTLGVGQTYTDFVTTGGRSLNTVYQNLTGKPIFVFVSGASSSATAFVDSASNPTTIAAVAPAGGSAIFASMSFIVPPNFYYKVTGGFGTLYSWSELR